MGFFDDLFDNKKRTAVTINVVTRGVLEHPHKKPEIKREKRKMSPFGFSHKILVNLN